MDIVFFQKNAENCNIDLKYLNALILIKTIWQHTLLSEMSVCIQLLRILGSADTGSDDISEMEGAER